MFQTAPTNPRNIPNTVITLGLMMPSGGKNRDTNTNTIPRNSTTNDVTNCTYSFVPLVIVFSIS